ncbi:MAG: 7TM domain-containing protein [Myxococcota bacterium]
MTITIVVLVGAALTIAILRMRALDWDLEFLLPETVFDVDLVMHVEGHGDSVGITTFIPASDARQSVLSEQTGAGDLAAQTSVVDGNRVASWKTSGLDGARTVHYGYRVRTEGVRFTISPEFMVGEAAAGADTATLAPTETIQSTADEVKALAKALLPADRRLLGYLQAAFERVQALGFKPFKGTTDALTALRLGEASCNGRSRLLAALMRAQGIPARLVGGIILESTSKRTSHQWVEVQVGGHWVPMDPTNHHFAELPYNYLVLYRGDLALFEHTSDVGFRYSFEMSKKLVPRQQTSSQKKVAGIWGVFDELGIPFELLRILIMIPIAAVVVVIFRNVLGLRTFGTFLPALIAAAAVQTGFLWGAAAFIGIILLTSIVRRLTARLQLLHSPQLGVLLTAVVGTMLLVSWIAAAAGDRSLGRVALFPIAILAITSERFVIVSAEEGLVEAWKTLFRTLLVVFVCYLTMGSLSLQILFLAFPELLLVIIAIEIWLGRWMGLRMTEWMRFKGLLVAKKDPMAGLPGVAS